MVLVSLTRSTEVSCNVPTLRSLSSSRKRSVCVLVCVRTHVFVPVCVFVRVYV